MDLPHKKLLDFFNNRYNNAAISTKKVKKMYRSDGTSYRQSRLTRWADPDPNDPQIFEPYEVRHEEFYELQLPEAEMMDILMKLMICDKKSFTKAERAAWDDFMALRTFSLAENLT